MSDNEVIRLYLKTQESAYFSILYKKYAGRVYAKCLSILKDEAMASDALQDIFMKILLNVGTFGEKSSFSTWIYSITYNYCIDQVRRKKKEQNLFSEDIENIRDVVEEDVPDEYLLELDVKKLRVVLDKLSTDDKTVLLMKYQDDMSIKEIADTFDKTESAIKMKIKRAKYKAKELCSQLFKEDTL